MLKSMATGDLRPEESLSALFVANIPDVDQEAIKVYLAILDSGAAHRSAQSRLFNSLGSHRTQGRFAILRALFFAEGGTLTQRAIRQDIRVTAPNVSQLINSLEIEGLVRREVNQPDRRVTHVYLTSAGRKVAEQVVPAMARLMTMSLNGFSADEKAQFHGFLSRFRANVESAPLLTKEVEEVLAVAEGS